MVVIESWRGAHMKSCIASSTEAAASTGTTNCVVFNRAASRALFKMAIECVV
jgi:hypothetical protein